MKSIRFAANKFVVGLRRCGIVMITIHAHTFTRSHVVHASQPFTHRGVRQLVESREGEASFLSPLL